MINTISCFNLDHFENPQNTAQDAAASENEKKDDFAALLDGTAAPGQTVVAVPVQAAPAVDPPVDQAANPAVAADLPEDLCWGAIEHGKKDYSLDVLTTKRSIGNFGPPVKLPPLGGETRETAPAKPDVKGAAIPPLPTRLPPREDLWSNENPRTPGKKDDFGLSILTNRRPILDAPEASGLRRGLTPPLATVDAPHESPINDQAIASPGTKPATTPASTGPAFQQFLPANPIVLLADDGEPVAPAPEIPVDAGMMLQDINGGSGNVAVSFETGQEETSLTRPGSPLSRMPFQIGDRQSSAAKNDQSVNLGQLFRQVSMAFASAGETNSSALAFSALRSAAGGPGPASFDTAQGLAEAETAMPGSEASTTDTAELFTAGFDKFRHPDTPMAKELKMDATMEIFKQAREILDQVKPGLLELAALTARTQEKQSMRMRLHPAELGAVDISLERNSAGTLTAHFRTGTDGARQVLTNNLDQLRESLQNAGWQVGQLQVSSGSSPFTSGEGRGESSPQFDAAPGYSLDNNSGQPDEVEQDAARLLNLRA